MAHARTFKIWFNRAGAVAWTLAIIPAFLWWRDSVAFVIVASIYANIKSDWATSEAADDREVLAILRRIEAAVTKTGSG